MPRQGVAIVYEAGSEGRAALRHAHALAAEFGVPLTVLTVASTARAEAGCGSAREGMAFRNELASESAAAELSEARELIASTQALVDVDYVVGQGSFARTVLQVAAEQSADVIVIPPPPQRRLRRMVSRDRAKMLAKRTTASVIVAPDAAGR